MNIKFSPLYAESWNVAFRLKSSGSIFNDKNTKFNIIPNSSKYWAADPMVFEYEGKIYIFAELYDYKFCRGTIGYTLFDGNSFGSWKQIIVEEFHMSFPNVFCYKNDIYMLPETSAANQLILYKAIDFPNKWKKFKVIANDIKWVDTVLYQRKNAFIGLTEQLSEPKINLMLRFDERFNLLKKEIIATDSETMRCGGRCFIYNNEVVCVCQDCQKKYGGALIFRFCNNDTLLERVNIKINPEELNYNQKILLDGMHTYTSLENMEVIDIKTRRFNFRNFVHRLINKLK